MAPLYTRTGGGCEIYTDRGAVGASGPMYSARCVSRHREVDPRSFRRSCSAPVAAYGTERVRILLPYASTDPHVAATLETTLYDSDMVTTCRLEMNFVSPSAADCFSKTRCGSGTF